jgi:hypothetical protein
MGRYDGEDDDRTGPGPARVMTKQALDYRAEVGTRPGLEERDLSEVGLWLSKLSEERASWGELVAELDRRLHPVLSPVNPSKSDGSEGPDEALSPVADELRRELKHLAAIRLGAAELLGRLAV